MLGEDECVHLDDQSTLTRCTRANILVHEMHSPQIIDHSFLASVFHPEALLINDGLGWYVAESHRRIILNHGGASEGMVAFIAMLPEERLGLVILTNVRFTPPT